MAKSHVPIKQCGPCSERTDFGISYRVSSHVWSVAALLDSAERYWIGRRSEGERLEWLADTRGGLGATYLPIQE